MTEKEKIVKIIAKNGVYNGRSLSFDYYVIQPEELADALIKARFGDVKEWKRRAETAERNATEWKNRTKALCAKLRVVNALIEELEEVVEKAEKETAEICIILANQHENGKEIAKDIAEKFDIEVKE